MAHSGTSQRNGPHQIRQALVCRQRKSQHRHGVGYLYRQNPRSALRLVFARCPARLRRPKASRCRPTKTPSTSPTPATTTSLSSMFPSSAKAARSASFPSAGIRLPFASPRTANTLLVANSKRSHFFFANPKKARSPRKKRTPEASIHRFELFPGTLSIIDLPA